jgi:uncharacterized protein (DUF983 family)
MRLLRALAAGVRLRCPACRRGRMTRAWWSVLTLRERCEACGIPFVPGRGETVGGVELAVYVSALVGLLGFVGLLTFGSVPLWAQVAWVIAFGALLPALSYRQFRGVWVAAMYAAQPWSVEGDAPHVAPVAMPATPWDEP